MNGFVASVTGDVIFTNASWVASQVFVANWYNSKFNDEPWANAIIMKKCRHQIPPGIDAKAQWIWNSDGGTLAYFRIHMPAPPAPAAGAPPTNSTAPAAPTSSQPEPSNACKHAQDVIDYTISVSAQCTPYFALEINETITALTQKYNSGSACANPCSAGGSNQCQHGSTCVPAGVGYTCKCQPGYSGTNCEHGGQCNLQNSVSLLYQSLSIWISLTSSSTSADWTYICSLDIDILYQMLAVEFMPCSATTEFIFESIEIFIQYTSDVCNNPPTPPTPPTCEVMGIAYCAFSAVPDLCSAGSDTCGGYEVFYSCLAALSITCCDSTNILIEAQLYGWMLYQTACPVTCNTITAHACLSEVIQAFPAGQTNKNKNNCGLISKADECIKLIIVDCDDFISAQIQIDVSVHVGPARGFCDNSCRDNLCRNGGICMPTSDNSDYTCQCVGSWNGTYCDQTPQCNVEKVKACVSASLSIIVSGIMDPCNNPIDCDLTLKLKECLQVNIVTCPSYIQAQITIIEKAIATVKCGSSPGKCVKPPPQCSFNELLSCAVTFVDTVSATLTNECGADYLTICDSYNLTIACFNQFTARCEEVDYVMYYQDMEAFMLSLTGGSCSTAVCRVDQAQDSLAYLTALIQTELAAGVRGLARFLMCNTNKNKLCLKIWEAVEVTIDSVEQCSSASGGSGGNGGATGAVDILAELDIQV